MTQTCHTGSTWGTVGSPPTGSLLCSVSGGVKSEPRGWSDLSPLPGTPIPVTRVAKYVSGRRPIKFGPPRGGGIIGVCEVLCGITKVHETGGGQKYE